jgi:precorrin-3B C17-methyltransferase/uroporphyrin-III C-methyltransferase
MSGALWIVGLGPGGPEHRTPAAAGAVRAASVVVGYGPYVDQCADLLTPAHEVVRGAMGDEAARADEALERARAGARVALVSSGDAGVYGMAARTLARSAGVDVVVIPGVTAALAAGALLGAPLADDWASVSLSDLHRPWPEIERRLGLLADAGVALALYNPRSRGRVEQFDRAMAILRAARGADVAVGLVTDAGRPGEQVALTTLGELDPERVTMRTLVLVAGDTATVEHGHLLATRSLKGSDPALRAAGPVRPRGEVTLVGAGPGDPRLLTLAAVDALQAADVVVYDRPSAADVVALAVRAEHVCVGLQPGRKALPQDEVNALLVDLGRERHVVRLKSGDPFVASRGGEEARALQDAGVPIRVIPGVSSALGAPAAAGIPLMLRQLSVTTTVVDGNDDPEHGTPPDWETLARLGGTLVILTGRGRIRRIAARLLAGGLDPETPIAAISAGSRPEQQVLRGTLADLPGALAPPVTFVVGAVAALDLTAEEVAELAYP